MVDQKASVFPKFNSFKQKIKVKSDYGNSPEQDDNRQEAVADVSFKATIEVKREGKRKSREYYSTESEHRRTLGTKEETKRVKGFSSPDGASFESRDLIPGRTTWNESDLFVVDKRGDDKNVEFGTLHKYSIPAYYQSGRHAAVGAPRMQITHNGDKSKPSLVKTTTLREAKRGKRPFQSAFRPQQSKEIWIGARDSNHATNELHSDFLPLSQQEDGDTDDGHSSSEEDKQNIFSFRTVSDISKKDHSSSFRTGKSDGNAARLSETESFNDHTRRHADLVRMTKEQPNSVRAWIDLITYQATLVQPGINPHLLGMEQKRAIANVRLAVYQKALRSVETSDPGYEKLLIGMLQEGQLVWEPFQKITQVEKAIAAAPQSVSIWTIYLNLVQTDFKSFNFDAAKDAFMRCLTRLDALVLQTTVDQRPPFDGARLYVFLRLTFLLKEAGYQELSWAAWQSLLETTFFRASDLESFEAFWDSEAPRIGEEGALGWCNGENSRAPLQDNTDEEALADIFNSSFADYASAESRLANHVNLPLSTTTSESDDPYCFIMYSDISELVKSISSLEVGVSVLDGFLHFVGLPTTVSVTTTERRHRWSLDQFLCRELHSSSAIQNQCANSYFLFKSAFQPFRDFVQSEQGMGTELCRLVDRVLLQLSTSALFNDDIAEYHLAFKTQFFPEEMTKLARKLLKSRTSSIRLYNAYAMAEVSLGRISKAHEIWKMALSMSTSSKDHSEPEFIVLIHSQVLFEADRANEDGVIGALLAMLSIGGSGDSPQIITAITRLKLEKFLRNGWVESVDLQKYHRAILFAECRALLNYIDQDHNLEAAVHLFDDWTLTLTSKKLTSSIEALDEAKMRLINFHLRLKRPYRPAFVRSEIMKSLALFPDNTMFLEMRSKHQSSFQFEDRIRASLRDDTIGDPQASIVRWSFLVKQEVSRFETKVPGYTHHSIRNLFSRALLSPDSPVRCSGLLWNMWFRFECNELQKNTEKDPMRPDARIAAAKARQVLFDGMRNLPWSKDWVILGLGALGRDEFMTWDECRQVYETVIERSLRLRLEKNDA